VSRCLIALLLLPSAAAAQIKPERLYNGINRPFPVKVSVPRATREASVQLLAPGTAEVVATANVAGDKADLAKLFPNLWTAKAPRMLYAQLVADGRKIGPAIVLQPMTNPPVVRLNADGKTVDFLPDEDQAYAGIRAYVDKHLVLNTSMGRMEFRLRPDAAPNTAFTIMELVKGGLYTDTIWHRVVAKRADGSPFVIQGGDPAGTGSGGPGFAYALEKSTLPHDFGVISIARSTDPNTNGCQVFVCLSREGTKHLDGRYASFGQLVRGADAVLKIGAVPVGKEDRPLNPPKIHGAELIDAAPYGTGPAVLSRPN
jgi:peptidyl-prolyl cis-trans isomerase B (cyclophilin B)